MADPNLDQQADDQRQPPNGASDDAQDGGDPQKELAAIKGQLAKILSEKKKLQADRQQLAEQAARWADVKADPAHVKALLAKLEDEDLQKARDSGEIDKLLQNQRQKFDRERDELAEQVKQKERLIEAITADRSLEEGLEKIKVKPGLRKAAFAFHRNKVKVISDSDAPHGIRVVVEIGGEYMGVDDYLRHWAENDDDAGEFLVSNQSSGGGALGGRGGLREFKPRVRMTPLEKSQYIQKHGKAAYDKLPWDQPKA